MRLLDRVRAETAAIAADATLVRIEHAAIAPYAAALDRALVQPPVWDAATHYTGPPAPLTAFVVTLDALNFGSGYFPHLARPAALSGYFLLAGGLTRRFETHGPWTADELQRVGAADLARLFGQTDADAVAGELMELFAQALRDLGGFLGTAYDGSFERLVAAAGGSAEALVEALLQMPFYRDEPFYKRAQITAADLALAGVARFDDLARLTMFADNLVPHVLRLDGLLRYDPGLLARIERGDLLPAGSAAEREIRAAALQTVELLVAALAARGTDRTATQVDHLLWNRGQGARYKAVPRHRTRSVFY